jgi:hypothetical protein
MKLRRVPLINKRRRGEEGAHCSMHEQARSSRAHARPLGLFEGAGATGAALASKSNPESSVGFGEAIGTWVSPA